MNPFDGAQQQRPPNAGTFPPGQSGTIGHGAHGHPDDKSHQQQQQPPFRSPPAPGLPHGQQQHQQRLHPQGARPPPPGPGQLGHPNLQQQHSGGGGSIPRSPIMSPFPRQDGQQATQGQGQLQGQYQQQQQQQYRPPGQAPPHHFQQQQPPQQNVNMHQQTLSMPDMSPKPAPQQLHVRPPPPGALGLSGQQPQQHQRPPMGAPPQGSGVSPQHQHQQQRQPSPGRPPHPRPMQPGPAGHSSPQLRPAGLHQRPPPPAQQQQQGQHGIRPSSSQTHITPGVENPAHHQLNRVAPPSPSVPTTRSPQMMPQQPQTVVPGGLEGQPGPMKQQNPPLRPSASHPQLVAVGTESASQVTEPGQPGAVRPPNFSPVQPHQQPVLRPPPPMNGSQQFRPRPPPSPQNGQPGTGLGLVSPAGASDPANHIAIGGMSPGDAQQSSAPASPSRPRLHPPHSQQHPQQHPPGRPIGARPPSPGQQPSPRQQHQQPSPSQSSTNLPGTVAGTGPTHSPMHRPPQRPIGPPPHTQQPHVRRDSTSSAASVGVSSNQDPAGQQQQQQQPQFRPGPPPPGGTPRPPHQQHPQRPPHHNGQFMRPPGSPTQRPLGGTLLQFPSESGGPGSSSSGGTPPQQQPSPRSAPRSPQQTARSLPSEKENAEDAEGDVEGDSESKPTPSSSTALPPPPMRAPGTGPPPGRPRGLNKVDPNKQLPAPMGAKEPPTSLPMGGPNVGMRPRVRPPPGSQQQHAPYRPPQRPIQTTPMMYASSGQAAQAPIPTSPTAGGDDSNNSNKDGQIMSTSTIPTGAEAKTTGMRPRAGSLQKRPVALPTGAAGNNNGMPPPKGDVLSPPSPKLHGRKGPAMLSTSARQGGSAGKTLKKWLIRGGLAYLTYTTLFDCPSSDPAKNGAVKGMYCKTTNTIGGLIKPYVEPHYTKHAGPHVDKYIKPVARQGQSIYVNYANPVVQGAFKVGGKVYDSTAKKHVDHAWDQIYSILPYPLGDRKKSASIKNEHGEGHRAGTSRQPMEVKEVEDDITNDVYSSEKDVKDDKDDTSSTQHPKTNAEEDDAHREHVLDGTESSREQGNQDHEDKEDLHPIDAHGHDGHDPELVHHEPQQETHHEDSQASPAEATEPVDHSHRHQEHDDANSVTGTDADAVTEEERKDASSPSPTSHSPVDELKTASEKRQDPDVPATEAFDNEATAPVAPLVTDEREEVPPTTASEGPDAQPVEPVPEPVAQEQVVPETAVEEPAAPSEPVHNAVVTEQATEDSHEPSHEAAEQEENINIAGTIPFEEPATAEPTEALAAGQPGTEYEDHHPESGSTLAQDEQQAAPSDDDQPSQDQHEAPSSFQETGEHHEQPAHDDSLEAPVAEPTPSHHDEL